MGVGHVFSNTSAMSIRDLLESNAKFAVPRFQRNYSWGREQALELWDDLVENFEVYRKARQSSNTNLLTESQYLLGSVVLVRGDNIDNEFAVIDGQQRLATLTILFCTIRDMMRDDLKKYNGSPPTETELNRRQIDESIEEFTRYGIGTNMSWKLVLNDIDREVFREIQEYEEEEETQYERIKKKLRSDSRLSDSQQHIYENYIALHDEISDAVELGFKHPMPDQRTTKSKKKESDKYDQRKIKMRVENIVFIRDFLSYVANNNFVVQVMIENDSTAFQVFETLNSRGSELAKSNLIKNHILNKAGSDKSIQEDLSRRWDRIFAETIGEQDHDEFVLESLRSRGTTTNHNLTTKNIYKIVRDNLRSVDPRDCKRFVSNLEQDAEIVATLNNPKVADDLIRDEVYGIQLLRAKLVRFPIVAACRKWGEVNHELAQLCTILQKYFFKARIVARDHPGVVDKVMTDVTSIVQEKPTSEILPEVWSMLSKKDDHDYFVREFRRFMRKPKKDTARYVLYQLNKEMSAPYPGVKAIENLTLEHILPKKPEGWSEKEFFAESGSGKTFADCVDRLGNLTLLELPPNAALKNKTFAEKMDFLNKKGDQVGYLGSRLPINEKTVVAKDHWSEKTIDEREDGFLELAKNIWSLDAHKC